MILNIVLFAQTLLVKVLMTFFIFLQEDLLFQYSFTLDQMISLLEGILVYELSTAASVISDRFKNSLIDSDISDRFENAAALRCRCLSYVFF